MRVHLVPGSQLSPEDLALWSRLQLADPALDNPYFRPEFVEAVAAVRNDVEVAVLEDGGTTAGFFPFQRHRRRTGGPVAACLSSFQAVIASVRLQWTAEDLVRQSGLTAWQFDHLIASQEPFRPYRCHLAPSWFMDLSQGFEKYEEARRRSGNDRTARARRSARKAERQIGPVRFVAHTQDAEVFHALLRWKSAQYVRSQLTDLFTFPWIVALLDRVRGERRERFSGMLSALYLGDRLAAVHLGLRSGHVLHGWFAAYNPEMGRYSPGILLIAELARAAGPLGIRRFDLGKGDDPYKLELASGSVSVAEGAVDLRPLGRALRVGWRQAAGWLRHTPLRRPAAAPVRWLRRVRDRFVLR